jgi:hypothetical protein
VGAIRALCVVQVDLVGGKGWRQVGGQGLHVLGCGD